MTQTTGGSKERSSGRQFDIVAQTDRKASPFNLINEVQGAGSLTFPAVKAGGRENCQPSGAVIEGAGTVAFPVITQAKA